MSLLNPEIIARTGIVNLALDKRTLPKKTPHNVKDLNYARNLPPECNGCPFRPIDKGGNDVCTEYKEDSLCVIRKDIAKLVDKSFIPPTTLGVFIMLKLVLPGSILSGDIAK